MSTRDGVEHEEPYEPLAIAAQVWHAPQPWFQGGRNERAWGIECESIEVYMIERPDRVFGNLVTINQHQHTSEY